MFRLHSVGKIKHRKTLNLASFGVKAKNHIVGGLFAAIFCGWLALRDVEYVGLLVVVIIELHNFNV